MQALPSMLVVLGFGLAPLLSFIVLSKASLLGLILLFFLCVVFGYYLNNDVRKVVR